MTHGPGSSSVVADEGPGSQARHPVTHWRRRFDLTAAASSGARPLDGSLDGSLDGVRVAVKDLFAVAGERVGAGNPTVLAGAPVETRHSAAVQRLVDHGAIVAGIARTDELAFSIAGVNPHEGTVVNPLRPDRLVGGSTSGPTAAVVAGEADLGLGTDTAGSIRVPASYCGLWGLRLTHGTVDVAGMWPLAPSFDAVGLVGRAPRLLAAAAAALGATDSPRVPERLILPTTCLALVDDDAREAFVGGVDELALSHGVEIELDDSWSLSDLERWFAAFRAVQVYEAWQSNKELLARPGAISPQVSERLRAGVGVDPAVHAPLLAEARQLLRARLTDGLICLPSTSGPAPRLDATEAEQERVRSHTLRLTFLASLAGLPALSCPVSEVGGQPFGISLVGAPDDDLALLRFVG